MKYMLDTNTCVYLMKNVNSAVEQYKQKMHLGISISSIVSAELYFGVYYSTSVEKNGANLARFLIGLETLEFDHGAAMEYGIIRATLQRRGELIGPMDMLIAAHAKARGLILVTSNIREFERVEGLAIESWA